MSLNVVEHVLLNMPNRPELIPGSSNFVIPENIWLPETWREVLSMDVLSEGKLLDIWQPLAKIAPNTVEKIIQHTIQIALAIFPKEKAKVNLVYIFQLRLGKREANIWGQPEIIKGWFAGYAATSNDIAMAEAKLKIALPTSYKEFVKIHNGFNPYPLNAGPRTLDKLFFLSQYNHLENEKYSGDKYLAFSGDGAGNEQCYNLMSPLSNWDYQTCDWDHETRQISKLLMFGDYLDRFFSTELKNAQFRLSTTPPTG